MPFRRSTAVALTGSEGEPELQSHFLRNSQDAIYRTRKSAQIIPKLTISLSPAPLEDCIITWSRVGLRSRLNLESHSRQRRPTRLKVMFYSGEETSTKHVSLGIILRDYLADILRDRRLAIFS